MATNAPRTLPGMGLTGAWPRNFKGWDSGMNDNLLKLSACAQLALNQAPTLALPASPPDGYVAIDPANRQVCVRDSGAWVRFTPAAGWIAVFINTIYAFNGSSWVAGGPAPSLDSNGELPYRVNYSAGASPVYQLIGIGGTRTVVASPVTSVKANGNMPSTSYFVFRIPRTTIPAGQTAIYNLEFSAFGSTVGVGKFVAYMAVSRTSGISATTRVSHYGMIQPTVLFGTDSASNDCVLVSFPSASTNTSVTLESATITHAGATPDSVRLWGADIVSDFSGFPVAPAPAALTGSPMISDVPNLRFTNVLSSNVNTLDYYEEGSWTPTIAGATTAGSATYSAQLGRYTRIGNTVTFNAVVAWNGHTGTGNMNVLGLPYVSAGGTAWLVAAGTSAIQFNSGYTAAMGQIATSTAILQMTQTGSNVNLTFLPISAAGNIRVAGSYCV